MSPAGAENGVFVLVEESAEAIVSADVEVRDFGGVGDWWRKRAQGPGVVDAAVGPACVVVPLVLV
jgi:hypothetical protein